MRLLILRPTHVAAAAFALALTGGCETPSGRPDNTGTGALAGGAFGALAGALIGGASHHAGLGAAIGGLSGALAGGLIGHSIDQQQRTWLYQNAPQTLGKVEYNDSIARQQAPMPPTGSAPLVISSTSAPPGTPTPSPATAEDAATATVPSAATASRMQQLTVEDIKALAEAGVKDDVIIAEIKTSSSKLGPQDIAQLQQAGVSSKIIDFIKTNAS